MYVPFGSVEDRILYFDAVFPKTEIWGKFLTGRTKYLSKNPNNGDAHMYP